MAYICSSYANEPDRGEDYEKLKNTLLGEAKDRGLAEGRAKGLEEGKRENSIEIAKKMLIEKVDVDVICKVTDFSKIKFI